MMTHKLLAGATLVLLASAFGPKVAHAQDIPTSWTSVWSDDVCSETSFNPCVEFELYLTDQTTNGTNGGDPIYAFFVSYVSVGETDQTGYMTAAGLYDYAGSGDWFFDDVELIVPSGPGVDWAEGADADCQQLSGGGNVLFQGCVANNDGINGGVPLGGYIQFNFSSPDPINGTDFARLNGELVGGDLGARVHIQGVNEYQDCSFKLDSPQGFVSGCGGPVVPEPMTVVLLATGLVGIGAIGYRNRRKEDEKA